jgi:hypothetical protein
MLSEFTEGEETASLDRMNRIDRKRKCLECPFD